KESFTKSGIKKQLSELGITLLGGGTDEAPMAYKNIEDVIGSQTNLINIEGSFRPLIVKMDKN
ncbi:MAG: RtcB family protein, partial [Chitinophagales bacterium]